MLNHRKCQTIDLLWALYHDGSSAGSAAPGDRVRSAWRR
jgi:hypothetical protein